MILLVPASDARVQVSTSTPSIANRRLLSPLWAKSLPELQTNPMYAALKAFRRPTTTRIHVTGLQRRVRTSSELC